MRILPASDSSVIVIFGDTIERSLHMQVVHAFRRVHAANDPRIRNLHPAYASMLVEFDPLHMSHDEAKQMLERLVVGEGEYLPDEQRRVGIPVCYCEEFGPDLPALVRHTGLSTEQVVAMHSSAEYFVCFLGFSPGFAYLGGLPQQLATPRLATPRKSVAAGSVGIAGNQTGVYPVNSPGGWQLIGRTPACMFSPAADPPTHLQLGDIVRFRVITREEYEQLSTSGGASE